MIALLKNILGRNDFTHGIHPPDRKALAADVPVEVIDPPDQVQIPLLQHTGAPCQPLVKNRQVVATGELIGQADALVSACVHASISGKAAKVTVATLPNGRHVPVVPIKAGGEQLDRQQLWDEGFGGEWQEAALAQYSPEHIVEAVQKAGIVGLGGAAFPTHVKLMRNEAKPTATLILNGCECEPYLTADYRLMLEAPAAIITGALLAARAVGAKETIVAIEDNKPAAIATLEQAAAGTDIQVRAVKTKYPMGGERELIPAVLGREVPTGGLPLDTGVVVINVGTGAAIAAAVVRQKPLTHRLVTVSGAGIAHPKNLLVPVGISYGALIDYCGGLRPDAVRVIAGGPMMGFALGNLDTPVTKGTSGITVLTSDELLRAEEEVCIRCGRCVDVCPLNLVPAKIAAAVRHRDLDLARHYQLTACCECGCCAYICPSNIPLVQHIRLGKALASKN